MGSLSKVIIINFEQTVMKNFFNRLFFLNIEIKMIKCRICCGKKFIEGQRVQIQQIYHSHRVGFRFCEKRTQQAAGGNDMIVVGFLFEIFKRVQRFRTFLDFQWIRSSIALRFKRITVLF